MATRLIIAIVQDEDAGHLSTSLRDGGFSSTKVGTTGGFLRRGNVTFLIGVEEGQVAEVLDVITKNCHTRTHMVNPYLVSEFEGYLTDLIEVEVGGAVVFVMDVDRMVRV
jgi:uncharacterized protein YaaQ